MTSSDRFPVPVRSVAKSTLTAWCCQNLSNHALNALTVQASTTELGKLFQKLTMRAEKNAFVNDSEDAKPVEICRGHSHRTKLCDVAQMAIFCVILRPVFSPSRVQRVSDLHSKFALRPHHVWKYGRHPISDR